MLLHLFILNSTKHCFSYVLAWLLSYLHAYDSLNHYANVQDIHYLIAPELCRKQIYSENAVKSLASSQAMSLNCKS